ncbi:hypothetical protein D3C71_1699350 [compost metagenome]
MQARSGDVGAAVGAFAIGARFDAVERCVHGGKVCGLALVEGELQLAFGGKLGARVFGLTKVVGSRFCAADDAAALRGQLGQQRRLLGQ